MAIQIVSWLPSPLGRPVLETLESFVDAVGREIMTGTAIDAHAIDRFRMGSRHRESSAAAIRAALPVNGNQSGGAAATRTNGGGLAM